ncbi:hypothetical protein K7432_004397 [Basidiobolus ranarum]|uniref:Chitin-binding type-1 domain-containing protein n=1 Tax=Basidiobolus ranarum TaxID=34480 RepID=A0ABR2WY77_9FUNG
MFAQVLFTLISLSLLEICSGDVITPGTGVVWKTGSNVTVSWTGSVETSVDVRLVHGEASNLQLALPNPICYNKGGPDGSCSYVVPSQLSTARDYAVTIGRVPENYQYSSYFTIQGKEPLPENEGCPNFGGHICPQSMPCCSEGGYCGGSSEYCGTGCLPQYSFNGRCVETS